RRLSPSRPVRTPNALLRAERTSPTSASWRWPEPKQRLPQTPVRTAPPGPAWTGTRSRQAREGTMRLDSLRLRNFRKPSDTHIVFDAGITGIIGANGSGKTTVLEAIAWALYGNTAARGTRDSIRHNRAGARAPVRVELDFELSGHRYRVARGLTSAELYLDGA